MTGREILLVYDKECPVCHAYCRMARIRESLGVLRLVDARDGGAIMDAITARGWDIDQGMVLKVENEMYYGADAIHALSLLSSKAGFFNRINYVIFRSRPLARIFYPVLRFFRNLLLKLLGRTKINNLDLPGNQNF